ncbi:MAG: glycosyltransferase [Sedimenticola sp.]
MIYINFLYAPSGGGYQNSLSFIKSLVGLGFDFTSVTVFVYQGSELHDMAIRNGIKFNAVKKGVVYKLIFELFSRWFLQKGDVVFSLFGPPMLTTCNYTLNVGGMAISNVFYKDVDFWGYLNPFRKFLKKVKDDYRKSRYTKLDCWIFETDLLMRKAINECGFPRERCSVVRMAPSPLVTPQNIIRNSKFTDLKHYDNVFLYLCGAHPNKRLHALPELAVLLNNAGLTNFKFVLTAGNNEYLGSVIGEAERLSVLDNFINMGPVRPDEVASIIDSCDYVCTISVLESFSNNFVEAWAMEKPLVLTDAKWARESCKASAYYINLDDLKHAAKKLVMLAASEDIKRELVKNGRKILEDYPSAESKSLRYIEILNCAIKIGKITAKQREGIRL